MMTPLQNLNLHYTTITGTPHTPSVYTDRRNITVHHKNTHIINGILYIDGYGISDNVELAWMQDNKWYIRVTGYYIALTIYRLSISDKLKDAIFEFSPLTDWENRVKDMSKKELLLNSKHEFKYFRDLCVEKLKTIE